MTMKTLLVLALGVASVAIAAPSHAQTYQWKDSSGRTVVSDTPPPGQAAKSARAIGAPQPSVFKEIKPAEPAAAEPPKTAAEKDLEFKKRQQENKEKAEKAEKEQKAAADKRDNCERARRQLTVLESNQPLITLNEKGEQQDMDKARREQEMARARQYVNDLCN